MLWKKLVSNDSYPTYVAVLEAHEVNSEKQAYGRREFRLKLADGTHVYHTFEAEEYRKWWSSFLKGGQVVNP